MKEKKDSPQDFEQSFKKRKRNAIVAIVIGVLSLVGGIIFTLLNKSQTSFAFYFYFIYVYGAVLILVGVGLLISANKKYKQSKAEQSAARNQNAGAANSQESAYTATSAVADGGKRKRGGFLGGTKQKFVREGDDTLRKPTFFVLTAVYAIILAVGFAGYFTGFGLTDEASTICKAICIAYAMLTPSYIIYFGAHNPFNINGGVAKTIKIVGAIVTVVCAVVGLVMASNLPNETIDGIWGFVLNIFLPAALIVAAVAYIAAYIWWCDGLPSAWYMSFGLGVTVLFPVATAIIIAFVVITFLIQAVKFILSSLGIIAGDTALGRGFKAGWTGDNSYLGGGYQIIDENGYTRTLTPYEGNRYRDDTGSYWVSDDGGNTFRRD